MAKTPPKKTAAKKTSPAKKSAPAKKVSAKASDAAKLEKEVSKLSKTKAAPKKVATKPKGLRPERNASLNGADEAMQLAMCVAQGMFEKKAEDIKILDMRNVRGSSTDFFVISHAESDKQVEAIASSAEEEAQKIMQQKPWHREGFENLEWVLLDYIDVVAHVFQREKREFYAVEELWGDALDVKFTGK